MNTNDTALYIRDRASFAINPPPREPTNDERLLAEAVKLIDQARELAQLTVDRAPEAKRITLARKYLDVTDPVPRPVNINEGVTP